MEPRTIHYTGRCHCGAIGFDYETALAPKEWPIRACQCTFCLSHAALSTSDPRGRLRFTAHSVKHLQHYQFAMKTSDFLLCKSCGVYIGAVIETAQGRFGIVNTRALATVPQDIADVTPMSYDTEKKSGRISRRETRWTPVSAMPNP